MGKSKFFGKSVPFWGKFCAAFVAAAAAVSVSADSVLMAEANGASAVSEIQDKIKQIQAENAERQDQINNFEDTIDENQNAMDIVSDQIDGVNSEISAYGDLILAKQDNIEIKKAEIEAVEKTIEDKEKEIEKKKAAIRELQAENKQNLEKFSKLARAMYMNDSSDTIPVLSGSNDWYDYFVYSDVVKNISGQNAEFMERLQNSIKDQENLIRDLNDEIDGLEQDKKDLEQEKADFEQEMSDLENDKTQLEGYAAEKREYLYGLAADNDYLLSKVESLNSDIEASNAIIEELNSEIEELIRQAQQNNPDEIVYGDGLRWPLDSGFRSITTYFGYDPWRGGNHRGIDVGDGGIAGANIYAAQSGTVISVVNYCSHNYGKYYSCGCGGGYGNYVIISHGGELSTLYAHCQDIYVYEGQQVSQGDVIGAVGTTGWSTGYHLHFEVRENGYAVDPFNYV